MTTTARYAVIRTASYNGSFRNAVDGVQVPTPEGTTFLVRSISRSRVRSTWGMVEVKVERVDADERPRHSILTWATREAAEAVAAKHTSDHTTYAVIALDVVGDFDVRRVVNEQHAASRCATTPGAWVETKGFRTRVLRLPAAVSA